MIRRWGPRLGGTHSRAVGAPGYDGGLAMGSGLRALLAVKTAGIGDWTG